MDMRSILGLKFSRQSFILFIGASLVSYFISHGFAVSKTTRHIWDEDPIAVYETIPVHEDLPLTQSRKTDEQSDHVVLSGEEYCDKNEYLQTLGPNILDNFIDVTDCNTVWIKTQDLVLRQKLKLFNAVLGQLTQLAFEKQEHQKRWKKSDFYDHFHGITVQKGGLLLNISRFQMVEKNKFITSLYLLPGSVIPLENKAYYTNVDYRSNTFIHDFFPCTTSGKSVGWSNARKNYSATCVPEVESLWQPSPDMDPRFYSYHGWNHKLRQRYTGYGKRTSFKADWNLNCPYCHWHPNMLTYVHIIRNAVMLDPAAVYQIDGRLKVLHLQCKLARYSVPSHRHLHGTMRGHHTVHRSVALTISNVWQGTEDVWSIWHTLGEGLTRLALYVPFLRANPHIAIHIKDRKPAEKVREVFLQYWNLTNEVVSGTLFAQVLILAEGNPCFQPGYLYLQTSQQLLANTFNLIDKKPDSILYIQRTTSRKIKEEKRVLEFLARTAARNNLKLNIFNDKNVPPLAEITELFHRSYLTIGAHGAGLTNIIFSSPRTAVLEIVCEVSPATFMQMCHKLGLRHHAFFGLRQGYLRCDKGISIEKRFHDFEEKVEKMLNIVLHDTHLN